MQVPPPVTLFIIITTLILSFAAWSVPQMMTEGMLRPYYAVRENRWYQMLTSGFLHANYTHLLFNMLTFYFFGPVMEQILGPQKFLALYLTALIFSSIPAMIKHHGNPNYAALGASGAVEAVLFGFILLAPFQVLTIFIPIPVPLPAIVLGVLFIAYSIWAGKRNMDNIGHDAHIAGAAYGIIFTGIAIHGAFPNFANEILGLLG